MVFIDDVHGWDFYYNNDNPIDGHGHGTHVPGTIGAVGNSFRGISGVSQQVGLLSLTCLAYHGLWLDQRGDRPYQLCHHAAERGPM
jgi:Subtilase family.